MCIFSLPLESHQPFLHSAQEIFHFNLHLPGDVGIIVISLAAISAASLGVKPRITSPLVRLMKLSRSRGTTGRCVAQSCLWNLAEASLS